MKIVKKNKLVRSLLTAVGLMGSMAAIEALATELNDTPEFAKLRAQYIEAVTSNIPKAVGRLVTDDYVLLQPNFNGPDVYGKKPYLKYLETLDKITRLDVKPEKVVSCDNWAIEIGTESLDLTTASGVDLSTSAHVIKVLKKGESGWRYARTFRAWTKKNAVTPPAAGSEFNAGWGTWMPDNSSDPVLVKEMLDNITRNTRGLVAGGEMVKTQKDLAAKGYDGPVLYGQDLGVTDAMGYMKKRQGVAFTPYDELRKYPDEGVVCNNGTTAFAWGKDIKTGSNILTGTRWANTNDFFYMFFKEKGQWKIGIGMTYQEAGTK